MPRPLVMGNGNLLITMDRDLSIRDFYWPYVGMLNHLSGHLARIGVWVDGQFFWLSDPAWAKSTEYVENTLVSIATASHAGLKLSLTINDCVLHREDILLRRIRVSNELDRQRECRVFFTHNFHIAETDIGDTAFYNPYQDAIIHYKRDNYFLLGAMSAQGGLLEYATGIKGFGGAEGTWRDAEDGKLSMNPVAQGSVDSTFSVRADLLPSTASEIHAWICAGKSLGEITRIYNHIHDNGFDTLMRETTNYWIAWSNKETDRLSILPEIIRKVFRRSLLTIRSNIDNRGAIIAANDSDIMQTARAHYSYMWPRDGALVSAALDRLGYQDITRKFFLFCRDILPKDRAALLHKYSAEGSLGATWHPWTVDGYNETPFQEDSTALVIWALWKHYNRYQDLEFIESVYDEFILPCADFMDMYRDPNTGLPLPSYDLWEERRGVHAYTCGTVYGALIAAANISDVFDDGKGDTYRVAADEIRKGMETYLWNESDQRFARMLTPASWEKRLGGDAQYEYDMTMDSAISGVWSFGAFPVDHPMVEKTIRALISRLWVKTEVGGIARYENDYYFRVSDDIHNIPGNPWFICTMWAAKWYISHAQNRKELITAMELLLWAANHVSSSGIFSEQLHPLTGEQLSVSPLTWSHAEFISATLDYLDRHSQLGE